MLKTKATIKVLDTAESGVSKSTGNAWQAQSMVLEIPDLDGKTHTIAVKTLNAKCIETLANATIGMECEVGLVLSATAREWTDKEGNKHLSRGTDILLYDVALLTF